MLETFHFLRPEWLIAIPLIAVLLFFLFKQSSHNSGWEDICDPALLQYQLAQQNNQPAKSLRLYNWTLPFIFLLALFALAGPTWEKKEQPVFQQGNALVIILDLSLSMNAKDLKPSRLERAKLKLIDILKQKKEGQTALIAFAGDAHIVSPLTIDNKTIMSLLPSLDSSIMPLTGSNLFDALTTAKQLFKNAGFTKGDILLLSDGIDATQKKTVNKSIKQLRQQGYRFSVIGVGSQAGSPIPQPRQRGFIKDQSGQVVLSKLEPAPLKKLANIGGGTYHKLSLDDSDFQAILDQKIDQSNNLADQDTQLEQWVDAGAYFSLLLIPLVLFSFRKGLLSLFLCLSITSAFISEPLKAEANKEKETDTITHSNKQEWSKNLWSTSNQQGQKSFNAHDYQNAADSFSNTQWRASANYRAGNFEKALEQYSQSNDAGSLYNKGNTLANMNKLEEAAEAYKDAVKKASEAETNEPSQNQRVVEDASTNLEYINKILEQQKQQQSEKNSDKQDENSDQQSEKQDQEQENNTDDASKSNESKSAQPEDKESEDSKSEGADSGEKQKESSDSDNESDSQEQDSQKNESKELEEAKALEDQKKEAPEDKAKKNTQSEPVEEDESNQEKTDSTQNDILSQLSQEEQQSLKQWLQRIPDNPGELLRIKFRNNTLLKQKKIGSTETQYEGNPW